MEFFISILYYFKNFVNINIFGQEAKILQGNIDLFYIIPILTILSLYKKKNRLTIINATIWFYPILFWAIVQFIFNSNIDLYKMIISLIKLFFCLILFNYFKDIKNIKDIDIYKTVIIIGSFYTISILPALLFKKSFLWRNNDYINLYTHSRLQLFYTEPSALGCYIGIIIMFLIYFIVKKIGNKKLNLILIIGGFYVLFLTSSLGSILSLLIALIIMLGYNLFEKKNYKILAIYCLMLIIGFIGLIIIINDNNPIYLRILDIIANKDPSGNYRINITNEILNRSFINSKGIGIGFGNINTSQFRLMYDKYGLVQVIANSFPYFIIETGIFGILYILVIINYIINKLIKNRNMLLIGLFFYIISLQIYGGYFTDTFNWIIYGLIINKKMLDLNKVNNHNLSNYNV